jgi:ligand-binding sensor domain-containing protein/signal transduction histidine kinase
MLACAAVLFAPFAAPHPTVHAEQLPIRTYTTADGLASDTVYRVVADSRGFLWFCTSDGLSRFDGYGFVSYTTSDGLPDRRVSDVRPTNAGDLWIATAGGLCRFDPHRATSGSLFVREPLGDDPQSNVVNSLVEAGDGSIWCGTDGGLYHLEERAGLWTPSRVDLGSDGAVNALAIGRWGEVIAGTHGLVHCVRPDASVSTYVLPGIGGVSRIKSVYVDTGGTVWVGMQFDIYRSSPRASMDSALVFADVGPGAPTGWGNAFFETREGTLWIATTTGLWRANNGGTGSFERRAALDGACDRDVWDVAEDRDGNLWLATSCGVLRIDRYGFTGFTKSDGLTSAFINSIFESNVGELIVTTNQSERRIQRFDGVAFTSVSPKNLPFSYPGWGWGQTVLQDHTGAWWVPIGLGVFRYPAADRPDAVLRQRPDPVYSGHEVFRVFEDVRGDVWLSTVGPMSLMRWDRATGRIVDLTAEAGVVAEFASFCNGPDGSVWIGTGNYGGQLATNGGLLRYSNGRFDRLTVADGVPDGWLRALYVDRAGRLWIASSLGGLVRVDDPAAERPRFVAYTTAEGLSSDNVWCVVEDLWGRIYAGTTRGVDRIDLKSGAVRHYTSADGLPKTQPQCAFRDRNGSLWFGSPFGVARFEPEPDREREPPRTLVTGLRVAGVARPVSALGEATLPEMELGPEENSVSLDYLGLGTSLGEALRYQYQLEGTGSDWSAPGTERTVTFANLAPGSYRLLVRAVDAYGSASPQPAEFAFTVLAPIWRRGWFLALAGLVVFASGYAIFRYRLARVLEIERVRMHIATDLHDDIGANLTRIAILSEVAQYGRAGQVEEPGGPLDSIAGIARESVASMSDIVWAINPGKDSVDDLVRRMRRFAGEAFASRGIELEFHGPEHEGSMKLGLETRRHLFLAFKECVMNAVKHSGGTRAEVDLRVEGRLLILTVADDGHGFYTSIPSEGNGLESLRRRATSLGGTFEVDSAPGRGTRATVSVPRDGARRLRRPVRMDR